MSKKEQESRIMEHPIFPIIHQLCKTKKEEYGEREHKNRRNRGL